MQADLEHIRRSDLMNYIAEVFYEEYKFLLKDNLDDTDIWIKPSGVGSRAFSKDVLDVSNYTYMNGRRMKDDMFIHISRNSIYHQLPEFIFHPISIRKPSMTTKDVVHAMKENKKREDENIQFFVPFDTELFYETLKLNNRHLHIYTDERALDNVFAISKKLVDKSIGLTKQEYYKLFLSLRKAEELKENLPALEEFFLQLLGEKVLLTYKDRINDVETYLPIGSGMLGADFGLQGAFVLEQEDILATIVIEESKSFEFFIKTKNIIREVLEFFVFSNRSILVEYRFEAKEEFLLGENFLGYDTKLEAVAV
ncbi:MAG: hypothetical protein P8P74_05500 [Crocinitomicaceae bacterium]|nr:hypothetical protein [Crocinitomicaceae bacterium]